MLLYNRIGRSQSQPHPFLRSLFLGWKIGVKDFFQVFFRDTFSLILNGNVDIIARIQSDAPILSFIVDPKVLCLYGEGSSLGHCF